MKRWGMSVRFAIEKFMIRLYLRYFSYIIYLVARCSLSFIRSRAYTPGSLLIIKPDAAGDYLLFRNFLEFIRRSERFRGYRITFLGNAVYRTLASTFDQASIDEFIWLDKTRIYWNIHYYLKLAREIFRRYEVTLHPVFSREFLFDYYVHISGVKERIGMAGDTININPAYKKISDSWYTSLIEMAPPELFEFSNNKQFFEQVLGQPISLKEPFITYDRMPLLRLPNTRDPRNDNDAGFPYLSEAFVVIFPGAQMAFRRWSTKNYAAICTYIYDRFQIKTWIVGGKNDAALAGKIMKYSRVHPVDYTGKTALHQLPALFSAASLLITNDTIAAHIGASVNTPTIVLSQLNHYGRFVPYPASMEKPLVCVIPESYQNFSAPELAERFRDGSRVNINLISVEQVKEAVDRMLSLNPARR